MTIDHATLPASQKYYETFGPDRDLRVGDVVYDKQYDVQGLVIASREDRITYITEIMHGQIVQEKKYLTLLVTFGEVWDRLPGNIEDIEGCELCLMKGVAHYSNFLMFTTFFRSDNTNPIDALIDLACWLEERKEKT
jgi:hypothetical protein